MDSQPQISFHDKVDYFMYPFMNELERELINRKDALKSIAFHADEANTDRELKEYLRDFILIIFILKSSQFYLIIPLLKKFTLVRFIYLRK